MTLRLLSLLGLTTLLVATSGHAHAACFPKVTLQSLSAGQRQAIPSSSTPHFIAVGFDPKQQPQLEVSLNAALGLKRQGASLEVAEVPVIAPHLKPHQPKLDAFMKGAVRNKALHPMVLPYYTDATALRSQLGVGASTSAVLLLCSPGGQTLWKQPSPQLTPQHLVKLKGLLG